MGTVKQKVEYLKETKTLIRNAIVAKGVEVPIDATFRDYAAQIGLIETDRYETPTQWGPYVNPEIHFDEIGNSTGECPTPYAQQSAPEYHYPEAWYDLETILDAYPSDAFGAKMIVQYLSNTATTTLYGADFYRTSDGHSYTPASRTDSIVHTWNTQRDRMDPDNSRGYRWVISYFTDPGNVNLMQRRYNTINENAVAVVTDGFRWQNTTGNTGWSYSSYREYQPFADRRYLQYVKTKNSDWSDIWNMNAWFGNSVSLEYVELDFNNGIHLSHMPHYFGYMFRYCTGLKYVKFSMPRSGGYWSRAFEYCRNLKHIDLDFRYVWGNREFYPNYMFEQSGLKTVNLIMDNNRTYQEAPFLTFEVPNKLKANRLTLKNGRTTSNSNPQNYVADYPIRRIEVLGSNDGKSWTVVGQSTMKLWTQLSQAEVTLNDSVAYKIFMIRFPEAPNSYVNVQNIHFYGKEIVDGLEYDWEQPVFSSRRQNGYVITARSNNLSDYPEWKAFANSDTRYYYWQSSSCSGSSTVPQRFDYMFYNSYTAGNVCYIQGGNKISRYYFGYHDMQYFVFETTEGVTSFYNTFRDSNDFKGVIIPDQEQIVEWQSCFYNCTALAVAPQIKFTADSHVWYMFENCSSLTNISNLDITDIVDAGALFAKCTALSNLNLTFPHALSLSTLCRGCTGLNNVTIHAPYMLTANSAFYDTTALINARVEGHNAHEDEYIWTNWSVSAKPTPTSNASHGNIYKDASLSVSDGQLWMAYSSADTNYTGWGSGHVRFNGTGCLYWDQQQTMKITSDYITVKSGYTTALDGQFRGRFWADKEKTIPLTDEFTTSGCVWTDHYIPVINHDAEIDTLTLEIIENPAGYASIGCIDFKCHKKELATFKEMPHMFRNSSVAYIELDTTHVENMSYAFYGTSQITAFPDFNYNTVTNMSYMFYSSGLSKVYNALFPECRNMDYAFYQCPKLVDVQGLILPKCTSMNYTFAYSDALQKIYRPEWSMVTNMSYAFYDCDALTEVDLSNLPVLSVCDYMFASCDSLLKAVLPTSGTLTNMYHMFESCPKLRQVEATDLTHVTTMEYAFYECPRFVYMSPLNIPECTTLHYAFYNCQWLQAIDLVDLSKVTTMDHAFWNNNSLISVNVPDLPACTTMYYAFSNNDNLVSIHFGELPQVTDARYLLERCYRLVDVQFASTPRISDWSYAFDYCQSLQTMEIPDSTAAAYFTSTWDHCYNLEYVSDLNMNGVNTCANMFRFCYKLLESPAKYLTTSCSNCQAMFEACYAINNWGFLADFRMNSVSNTSYMFRSCRFKRLSIKWTLNSGCNMNYMFDQNPELEELTLDFNNCTLTGEHRYMFRNDYNLRKVDLINAAGFSNFMYMYAQSYLENVVIDMSKLGSSYVWFGYCFDACPNLRTVTINFDGKYNNHYSSNSDNHYVFRNCPKLETINFINAQNFNDFYYMFAEMTNEKECIVNWNDVCNVKYDRYFVWYYACTNSTGAPLRHINCQQNPKYYSAHEKYCALNDNCGNDYISRPMDQYVYLNVKLPVKMKLESVEFCQRGASDEYERADYLTVYKDKEMTIPLSARTQLDNIAYGRTTVNLTTPTILDNACCYFGKDMGRHIGCSYIKLNGKVRGKETYTQWSKPTFSSNTTWGSLSCSGYKDDSSTYYAYRALNNSYSGTTPTNSSQWRCNSWIDPEVGYATGWWQWKFAQKLRVRQVRIYQMGYNQDNHTDKVQLFDFGGVYPISEEMDMPQESNGYVEFNFDNKLMSGFRVVVKGTDQCGIGEITIDADTCAYEYYDWDSSEGSIIDFNTNLFGSNFDYGFEITGTDPRPGAISSSDHYWTSYLAAYAYQYHRCSDVYIPPFLVPYCSSGSPSYYQFNYGTSLLTNTAHSIRSIHDYDFYNWSSTPSNWAYRNTDYSSYDGYYYPPITCLDNPMNIRNSVNFSDLALTHDSILQVFDALMSRVGTDAATLTIGSAAIAQLSDEEKAIALNKNWNLA